MHKDSVEVSIAGIPAIVNVIDFVRVKGSFSHNAPSDLDYYGYCSFDYEICDRRGRPAPWLEKKVKDTDIDRIETAIREHFAEKDKSDREDHYARMMNYD